MGRNHPLVEGLARHLFEEALENIKEPIAARCGFTTTDVVEKRTTLILLRLRHLLDSPKHPTLLAEECAVVGFWGSPSNPVWLEPSEALSLLEQAVAVDDIGEALKKFEMEELLARLDELSEDLELFAKQRSQALVQSHRRVRAMTKEGQIRVKQPAGNQQMDILGVYVLQPGQRRER